MSNPLDTLTVGPYRVEVYRERVLVTQDQAVVAAYDCREGLQIAAHPWRQMLESETGIRALRYAFEAAAEVAADSYDKHLRWLADIHRDLRDQGVRVEWRYRLLVETEEQLGDAALAVREARAALNAITGELGFARAPADYPDGYHARREAARAALETAILRMYERT